MRIGLLLTVLIFPLFAYARVIIEQRLEPAIAEIKYTRRKVLDTLDITNDYKDHVLTLKIGVNVSAFYSSELKTTDSIEYRHREAVLARYRNRELYNSVANLPTEVVFKNFPSGKIRVHDMFDLCDWLIDEDWEKPEWSVTDSVSNILGYDCLLAETIFRGRQWKAWFAPDIPIPDGPWKLCGLPGLILRAYDSKRHYVYDATSIRTEGVGYVEYYDYDAGNRLTSRDRRKSLSRKLKHIHTDLRYKILSSGAYGVKRTDIKERKVIPHTNYDFEETDYPHE